MIPFLPVRKGGSSVSAEIPAPKGSSPYPEVDPMLVDAASVLIQALEAKDAEAVAEALEIIMSLCSPSPKEPDAL